MNKRLTLLTVMGALSLSFAFSVPAAADTVTRSALPALPPFTIRGACSFDFQVAYVSSNQTLTSFYDSTGTLVKQIISGRLALSFTNLSTGQSITENVSGPTILTFSSDGSTTVQLPGGQAGGLPNGAQFLGSGYIVIQVAPDGTATVTKEVGNFGDLCQLLA